MVITLTKSHQLSAVSYQQKLMAEN